jgi:hypothetical protein
MYPNFAPPDVSLNMSNSYELIKERVERTEKQRDQGIGASPEAMADSHRNVALRAVIANLKHNPPPKQPELPKTPAPITNRGPVILLDDLAIGKLLPAKQKFRADAPLFNEKVHQLYINLLETRGCHFCVFDSDWGVKDSTIQLDSELSPGYCNDDKVSSSQFYKLWKMIEHEKLMANVPGNTRKEKEARLVELDELENGPLLKDDETVVGEVKEKTFSKIDGKETTNFQGLLFCR